MAVVDFSNAVLDVSGNNKPMANAYLNIAGGTTMTNASGTRITSGETSRILSNTISKVSILKTGIFTASGTECFLVGMWRISNISFSPDDTYAFVIDIETSVNT